MKALALGTTVYIDPSQCDASTREELGGAVIGTTGYPRGGDQMMVWIGGQGRERTVTQWRRPTAGVSGLNRFGCHRARLTLWRCPHKPPCLAIDGTVSQPIDC